MMLVYFFVPFCELTLHTKIYSRYDVI